MGMRDDRRQQLYGELQQAYDAWIEACAKSTTESAAPVDVSGCAEAAKASWFNYLEARRRLIADFGEP